MEQQAWQWQPRGVGELLDGTFRVLRARFGLFFAVNALLLVPLAILQQVMAPPDAALSLLESIGAASPEEAELIFDELVLSGNLGLMSLGATMLSILTLIVSALQSTTSMWITNEHIHGRLPDLSGSLAGGLRHVPRALGTLFLVGIMLFVLVFVLGLVAAVFFFMGAVGIGVFIVLAGFVCFVLFVAMRWLLIIPVSVAEDRTFGHAVQRSYELSRRAIGAMLGRLLIMLLLSTILTLVPAAVIGLLIDSLPIGSEVVKTAFAALIGVLLGAVVQPLTPIMLMLLYYDRRVRREGYDLQQQVAQLDS